MIRLAVFAVLILALVLLARSYFPPLRGKEGSRLSLDMVQDPNCEIYIPKSGAVVKTVSGNTHYFCSRKCADEFEQKRHNKTGDRS